MAAEPLILAPAENWREAALLVDEGAGALYCGYVPGEWLNNRSAVESFNRRTFAAAQVTSREEMAALAALARERRVPLSVTFNAACYPPWMLDPVLRAARELAALGVTGFIVSDPGLIVMLREEGLGPVTVSVMGGVFNRRAASFFRRLGAERVSLPRELSTAQISALARAHPDIDFDVFVLFGACANIEAFCRWVHDDPLRVWPCVQSWLPETEAEGPARAAAAACRSWSGISRAWACGLCALAALVRVPNVDRLKVVGRGAPTPRKLAGIRLLRQLLDEARRMPPGEEFNALARAAKQRVSGFPCQPHLCYFPEYL